MNELIETNKVETDAYSTQGLCFDGTYYYVSDNGKLYKYNTSGTKVAERDCTSDGTNHHLGDLCVVAGVLYVTSSDYPNTPYNQYVKEYDASDLDYRDTEYFIDEDFVGEGIDYNGANFWTVSNDNVIQKWETGFTDPTTYLTDVEPKEFTSPHGFQGMKFYGGSLYLNPHEGAFPPMMMRFELSGGVFEIQEYIPRPKWCSQGFDIYEGEFILAGRGYGQTSQLGAESDSVVIAQLEPYDNRRTVVQPFEDFPQETITSSSYAEVLTGKIYARKDDVVRVKYQGNFKVSSGSVRAYLTKSGGTSIDILDTTSAYSMRSNETSSEGELLTQIREFIAREDGVMRIGLFWKKQGGGTGYVQDQTMTLQIAGKFSD